MAHRMKHVSITVLMAVRNGERFLRQAIDSILAQSRADFEFIVVDDASGDTTPDILGSYADPRLRVIRLARSHGLAAALNAGIDQAGGNWIARMDADDIAEPERLAVQTAALAQSPDIVLVGSAFTIIDEDGTLCGEQQVTTDNPALQANLLEQNPFCHPSVMIRTDALRDIGGYRSIGGMFAQDYDLWLRLAECGEVINVPMPLLRYRIHPTQTSVDKALGQRRAAELYKLLAQQRRAGRSEDLQAAQRELEARSAELRTRCAIDLLHTRSLLEKQNRLKDARAVAMRAVITAPFSRPVRDFLWASLHRRLRAMRNVVR